MRKLLLCCYLDIAVAQARCAVEEHEDAHLQDGAEDPPNKLPLPFPSPLSTRQASPGAPTLHLILPTWESQVLFRLSLPPPAMRRSSRADLTGCSVAQAVA